MAKVKLVDSSTKRPKRRPALTPEARENQLISMAVDLVEERLANGTASAQETVHFLRLGSTKAKLEKQKLEADMKLQEAKVADIEARRTSEAKFEEAIKAFKRYSGQSEPEDDEEWY